jgi:hypothetical protein
LRNLGISSSSIVMAPLSAQTAEILIVAGVIRLTKRFAPGRASSQTLIGGMARGGIEPQRSPEGDAWEAVRPAPGMARGGIEPQRSPEGDA